jgi:hypothetical protein
VVAGATLAVVAGSGFGAAVKLGGCLAMAGVVGTAVAVAVATAVAVVAGIVATVGGVGETAGALSAGFSVTIVQAGMTTARPTANNSALCSIFMITAFK